MIKTDSQTCPGCHLPVSVDRERRTTVVRYDMAAWQGRCRRKEGDGPLACPWMRAALRFGLHERPDAAPAL
jgi:hypothetical protein